MIIMLDDIPGPTEVIRIAASKVISEIDYDRTKKRVIKKHAINFKRLLALHFKTFNDHADFMESAKQ